MAPQQLHWPPGKLPATVHGTSLLIGSRGLLIVGPSGSGKSSVAIQMIALGGKLISDDLTRLTEHGNTITMECPTLSDDPNMIEARGIGLVPVSGQQSGRLDLVVDMSETELERLPEPHSVLLGNHTVRCLRNVDNPAFPAMVMLFIQQM